MKIIQTWVSGKKKTFGLFVKIKFLFEFKPQKVYILIIPDHVQSWFKPNCKSAENYIKLRVLYSPQRIRKGQERRIFLISYRIYNRLALIIATVATDSAVFVATVAMDSVVFVATLPVSQKFWLSLLFYFGIGSCAGVQKYFFGFQHPFLERKWLRKCVIQK